MKSDESKMVLLKWKSNSIVVGVILKLNFFFQYTVDGVNYYDTEIDDFVWTLKRSICDMDFLIVAKNLVEERFDRCSMT